MTPDLGPVPSEFFLSQLSPLEHEPKGTRRKTPRCNTALDLHDDQELAVTRVEMRRGVITIIHFDRNAEEAADHGHGVNVPGAGASSVTDPFHREAIHCIRQPPFLSASAPTA